MSVEFDPSLYTLVTTETGEVLTSDDGSVYVIAKSDGSLQCLRDTNVTIIEEPLQESSSSASTEETSAGKRGSRGKWSREAIMELINLRINYDDQFKSTSTKNDVIWKRLAASLLEKGFPMSASQCNDKWRYLKSKYAQKKDNMGDKGTGEPPLDFEYFEVLDHFLSKKHNIQPIAIASSMQGDTSKNAKENDRELLEDVEEDGLDLKSPTKRKKTTNTTLVTSVKNNKHPLQKIVEDITKGGNVREENRERRHHEILEVRNRAINVFSEKMDALLDTLLKKK